MTKVIRLLQTTFACPSQWEGWSEGGLRIYIRYRFGELSWGVAEDLDQAIEESNDFAQPVGGDFDGLMSTEEMKKLLGSEFDFSKCETKILG